MKFEINLIPGIPSGTDQQSIASKLISEKEEKNKISEKEEKNKISEKKKKIKFQKTLNFNNMKCKVFQVEPIGSRLAISRAHPQGDTSPF